jgi:hypothetical protein
MPKRGETLEIQHGPDCWGKPRPTTIGVVTDVDDSRFQVLWAPNPSIFCYEPDFTTYGIIDLSDFDFLAKIGD